jgi:hypothetical protein
VAPSGSFRSDLLADDRRCEFILKAASSRPMVLIDAVKSPCLAAKAVSTMAMTRRKGWVLGICSSSFT